MLSLAQSSALILILLFVTLVYALCVLRLLDAAAYGTETTILISAGGAVASDCEPMSNCGGVLLRAWLA